MRKLTTMLVFVLALLLSFTNAASAVSSEPGTFTISGYTTSLSIGLGPTTGDIRFHIRAKGAVHGYFTGRFIFEEWGRVDVIPSSQGELGHGINHGILMISNDSGTAIISFTGQSDLRQVWGDFTVEHGTGVYETLRGQGTYTGDAGLVFSVTFSGQFDTG